MGLIDRIKRRLPLLGSPKPQTTSSYQPPPRSQESAEEEVEPVSPRGALSVKDYIEQTVKAHPVVLFMKGSPAAPQCGFSASAAGILSSYQKPFHTVNVLADMDVREGVKEFTGWPTIPQVFIKGEFIGGSDILKELHSSGELKKLLEDAPA
jgi:monothiol glutaredoxin